MEYFDIYKKRINRYGNNTQERIQNQREKVFDIKVQESVYKVSFEYDNKTHYGTLERGSQDNTETIQYLLTKVDLEIPTGTILTIVDLHGKENKWMIYYLEQIQAGGYNKYIVLKMTHYLEWKDRSGNVQNSWAYIYGQEDNMLKDELRSRSRTQVLYTENIKLNFMVMPVNEYLKKDIYFTLGVDLNKDGVEDPDKQSLEEAYVVTGYDIISTPGVMFVSMDPTFIRNDKSETVVPTIVEEEHEECSWLTGDFEEEEIK